MALVYTTKGLIDSSELRVEDIITLEDNARVMATEWFDSTGEMVRRDVWVSALRPIDIEGQQGG